MPEMIHDFREIKIRKKHYCALCYRDFGPEAILLMGVFKNDGEIYNFYSCHACQQIIGILQEKCDYYIEEFCEGFVYNKMNQDHFDGSPEEYIEYLEEECEK